MSAIAKAVKSQPQAPNMELVGVVAARARLDSIRCRSFRCELLVDEPGAGTTMQTVVAPQVKFRSTEDRIFVRIGATLTGSYVFGDRTVDVVSADVEMQIEYSLGPGDPLTKEACDAFAALPPTPSTNSRPPPARTAAKPSATWSMADRSSLAAISATWLKYFLVKFIARLPAPAQMTGDPPADCRMMPWPWKFRESTLVVSIAADGTSAL